VTRTISTLLVPNRGEIALRIFRTARSMGIRCVAVYADADADAPFVRAADYAVPLRGGYLDAEAVIDAAVSSGADAIHPGYGFLSENAAFARDVLAAGLVWVGPSPDVIERMGDKLAAKRLAIDAGVTTLPFSEDPMAADAVGYPLLVKAAAGGGGKGMHVVEAAADLAAAVATAQREAAGGFGDDRVFLERYVARSRHVEMQVLGDAYGNVVHLGERECSIQRRHQKIVEESPSTAVDSGMRAAMGGAALSLAGAMGYSSAGTVEFLVDDDTHEFFFIEVNTRLQVEHPVTEEVTGIDLVREQIRIAAGDPLGYSQGEIVFAGHAIEARLYAEDPAGGFLPATGTLAAYAPAGEPEVRWDSGVEAGSVVGVEFDPMLAKVIAHAPTRAEAVGRLALALERLHLGGVATNRDFLVGALRSPELLAGDTTTDFIGRAVTAGTSAVEDADVERAATVAALWLQGENRASATVLAEMPTGWRNARLPAQQIAFLHGGRRIEVAYRSLRDGTFRIGEGRARVYAWSRTSIDAEVDGRRATRRVTLSGDTLHVQVERSTIALHIVQRFHVPGSDGPTGGLVAPMPGLVVEVLVAVGESVVAGRTLVVLEAMKMEHHMSAPEDGVVTEVCIAPGQQVDNGTVLMVIEPAGDDDGVARDSGETNARETA